MSAWDSHRAGAALAVCPAPAAAAPRAGRDGAAAAMQTRQCFKAPPQQHSDPHGTAKQPARKPVDNQHSRASRYCCNPFCDNPARRFAAICGRQCGACEDAQQQKVRSAGDAPLQGPRAPLPPPVWRGEAVALSAGAVARRAARGCAAAAAVCPELWGEVHSFLPCLQRWGRVGSFGRLSGGGRDGWGHSLSACPVQQTAAVHPTHGQIIAQGVTEVGMLSAWRHTLDSALRPEDSPTYHVRLLVKGPPMLDVGIYSAKTPAFTDRQECGLRGTDGSGFLRRSAGAQLCARVPPPSRGRAAPPPPVSVRDRHHGCEVRFAVVDSRLRYTVDGADRPPVLSVSFDAEGPTLLFDGGRGVNLPRRDLAPTLHAVQELARAGGIPPYQCTLPSAVAKYVPWDEERGGVLDVKVSYNGATGRATLQVGVECAADGERDGERGPVVQLPTITRCWACGEQPCRRDVSNPWDVQPCPSQSDSFAPGKLPRLVPFVALPQRGTEVRVLDTKFCIPAVPFDYVELADDCTVGGHPDDLATPLAIRSPSHPPQPQQVPPPALPEHQDPEPQPEDEAREGSRARSRARSDSSGSADIADITAAMPPAARGAGPAAAAAAAAPRAARDAKAKPARKRTRCRR